VSERTLQPQPARRSAFADLYRRYAPWLTAKLRPRFGPEAEDIGQDAWLRLAALDRLDAIRHPKAFLLRTATNLALDRYRHGQVVARSAHLLPTDRECEPDQLEAVLLEDVICGLPAPLRDVFVLSRFRGLSQAQIGEHLGISERTVEWRMSKALALCAKRLAL